MDGNDRDLNPFNDDPRDTRDTRDDDTNLGRQGMGDQLKGKMNEAAGNVQKKVGEMTDNEDMQAEGEGRELKGKMEQGLGEVKRTADDVLDH